MNKKLTGVPTDKADARSQMIMARRQF